MAKHLTPREVRTIVSGIRGWSGKKLTWKDVCREATRLLGRAPARQTLSFHEDIRAAYSAKRESERTPSTRASLPGSLSIAAQRLTRQQSEIDELKKTNAKLMEQFVRWQYNAYKYGMSEAQLDADLPRIDRGRTESEGHRLKQEGAKGASKAIKR